jgi:uncharacterized protein YkwD
MKKILFAAAIIGLIFYIKSGSLGSVPFVSDIKNRVEHLSLNIKLPTSLDVTQFFKDKLQGVFHNYELGTASSTGALIIPHDVQSLLDPLKKITTQVITPPPIKQDLVQASTSLTRVGVIHRTNTERILQNLPPLQENSVLDAAAKVRADDLFARQYFAHIAPTGEGVSSVVTKLGYDYAVIGENLALGRFEDDKALVDAWMASPGHRENILNTRYREIGVAVVEGVFKGEKTWIGVQVFGLSLASCPAVDINLHATIDAKQKLLNSLETQATTLKQQIDTTSPSDPSYNSKIDNYNALVPQINGLIAELDILVKKYNEGVQSLNKCIAS